MTTTTIRQSHKHPTLCTVTVDGYSNKSDEATSDSQPEHHWRLPNTDPRNEGKYLFRLHTLDVYFWKAEDAHAFIAAAKKKLQPDQVVILDAPSIPAPHEQVMSPVVQQLENVAIQDPAYHNGQTRNSRATPVGVADASKANVPDVGDNQDSSKLQGPAAFQPLAYNPAAPAAPEPIKHREKTPPPVDAEDGTGLAGAAYRDHNAIVAPHPQSSIAQPSFGQIPSSQGYVNAQPPQARAPSYTPNVSSTQHTPVPPSAQGHRTSSVSSFPPPPPQSGRGSISPYTPAPAFAPPPQGPQSATPVHPEQALSTFSAPPPDRAPFYRQDTNPPESPATEILGDSYIHGVRQPLQHLQPQYASYTPSAPAPNQTEPIGGYSNYQYGQPQSQHHNHQSSEYDVHSQVYRPTLEEASKHKPSKTSNAGSASPSGRLEQNAGKVDKKVNSFFKRLEKKVG